MKLFYDSETRSRIKLAHGTVKYATAAEKIIVTYAIDDSEVKAWEPLRKPIPADLAYAAEEADEIWAHNAWFDFTIAQGEEWARALKGFLDRSRWRCMMARLLAHGMPGGLDKAGQIFKIDEDKAKTNGKDFIKLFCVPNKRGEYNDWNSHPAEWKNFLVYATRDVSALQALDGVVPRWNYAGPREASQRELALWHLDQTINARGFAIDRAFAEGAVRATSSEKARLNERTVEATEGLVQRATQRDAFLVFLLLEYGVSLPDLRADTLERRLDDPELPEFVKELLRIRLQVSKASTSKYKRVLEMEVGGRMYGTVQFCAANRTGRWGGRGFQPQNQPRPTHKFHEIEEFIDAVKNGAEELVYGEALGNDSIMAHASSAIRSVIVASPGRKLVVSDLSNIEGRKLAWLSDEEWKLEAFRKFDRKEGPDLYKVAYARSFGVDPSDVEDDSDERQIGKVQELALGYQGGVNAFVTMAATYGMDLEEMARKAWDSIPSAILRDARGTWQWAEKQKRTLGLSEAVYVVCEAIKTLWREAHPNTVSVWSEVENAARNAIQNPKVKFKAAKCVFLRTGEWLIIELPSGRYLVYPRPRVDKNVISYMGVNVYNKKWHRMTTYGGKIIENIDQGSSRDVIASAMPRAEEASYPIVLTVHDELVTEPADREEFNDKALSAILATNEPWNEGLPLAAKGMMTYRYRKG